METVKTFDGLHERAAFIASGRPPVRVVLCGAEDKSGITALEEARRKGFVEPVLVGEKSGISAALDASGAAAGDFEIHDVSRGAEKAAYAVELVRNGKAEVLMKGLISTSTFLHPIFRHESGLLAGKFLSHCGVLEVPGMDRLVIQTDGAINIAPDMEKKKGITKNSVYVARMLGISRPKVALIAATEKVHPKMPATVEAAELARWAKEAIPDADVDGPMGLDIAVSEAAAATKGVKGPVAGQADVLVAPFIEVGNVIYKALRHFARAQGAGIVVGARCPVLLASRSDPPREKANTLALGVLYACSTDSGCWDELSDYKP
jgi:phosphate butyryltransferase